MYSRVARRDSSVSSAAVRQTGKKANGLRFSVHACRLAHSAGHLRRLPRRGHPQLRYVERAQDPARPSTRPPLSTVTDLTPVLLTPRATALTYPGRHISEWPQPTALTLSTRMDCPPTCLASEPVAVSDHPREYGARPAAWGVALADLRRGLPDWLGTELRRLRRETHAVIVFPHWGPNMTTEPAGWQRKRAAELLAAGATLVAGHSAHVFHGVERHAGGFAAYDLGGAIDDYAVDEVLRNDLGLLALWSPDGDPELELVGLRLRYAHTELAAGADADWIATRLGRACAELGSEVRPVAEGRQVIR